MKKLQSSNRMLRCLRSPITVRHGFPVPLVLIDRLELPTFCISDRRSNLLSYTN